MEAVKNWINCENKLKGDDSFNKLIVRGFVCKYWCSQNKLNRSVDRVKLVLFVVKKFSFKISNIMSSLTTSFFQVAVNSFQKSDL